MFVDFFKSQYAARILGVNVIINAEFLQQSQ